MNEATLRNMTDNELIRAVQYRHHLDAFINPIVIELAERLQAQLEQQQDIQEQLITLAAMLNTDGREMDAA